MLRLRFVLSCFLCFASSFVFGQVNDSFLDGNFSSGPAWNGDAGEWEVLANELHLNKPGPQVTSDTSYLSTASAAICSGVWEFNLRVTNNPSTVNYLELFLASDIPNIKGLVNGYCLRIGFSSGTVTLHAVTNGVLSASLYTIPAATAPNIITANVNAKIRVTRTGAGIWNVWLDNTAANGSAYVLQGTATSLLYTNSSYFGVWTKFSSTRFNWCFFDNFLVTGAACPDTTKPTVISVIPNSTSTATVTFSERVGLPTAQTPSNYILNYLVSPVSATIRNGDSTKIDLDFGTPSFTNCANDSVKVINVQDRAGNAMIADTLPSIYFVPGVAGYKTVVLNEIMAGPSGSTCISQVEYVEIYNRSNFPVDLQNWKIFNSSPLTITSVSHPLCPGEYAILCSPTNATTFPANLDVIGVLGFSTLNNTGEPLSLRSNLNVLVDSFAYASAASAISWELVNPTDTCSTAWLLSTDPCGGTPGALNSVNNTALDVTPPSISSIAIAGAYSIVVCFTEPIASGGGTTGNYSVSPTLGAITSAVMTPGNNCVTLTFTQTIDTFQIYTLTINNLQDCRANTATDSEIFMISGPVPLKRVIFNEIYFDLSPAAVGLPSVEYVELYNRSIYPVNLSGWKFKDSGVTQHVLGNYILMPNAYVLLTDVLDTAAFTGLPYLGVPSFPALDDGGDNLSLRDQYNNLVDFANYDISWYNSPSQDGGGWSIELVNPTDTCNTVSNWHASNDPSGGTPGIVNSVFSTAPDITPPTITSITVTNIDTVVVCFSEGLAFGIAATATNYTVNGLTVTSAVPIAPDYSCVTLALSPSISTGIVYTLTATGIEDCAGNSAPTSGDFLISGPASPRAVIINEIFFDPDVNVTALPNVEYVELYNRSTTPFDLAGWKFRDSGSPHTLLNYVLMPGAYVILCKESDTASYSGVPYLGMSAWPSLNNTGDNLGLRDPFGSLIDSVQYVAPEWYHDPSKDGGGWSIELRNPNDSCNAVNNWAASEDSLVGGTPGRINSIYSTLPDTIPPHILSVSVLATDTVLVCFDEGLDLATANMIANYTVSNGLVVSNASLVTPANTCVRIAFTTAIDTGTVYTLTATGVEDCTGNDTLSTGIFVINGPAHKRSVIFNEIMADPDPVVGQPNFEYLELYNRDTVAWDLTGWTLHNGGRRYIGSHVLLPNAYVLLVKESDTAAFSGLPYVGLASWPGLTNSLDQLGLRDPYGNAIDTVSYLMSWYQDPLKDDGGWSLELVNPTDTCALIGNWIASNDTTGGTPGRVNSVYNASQDLTPPTLLSTTATDSNLVVVCFDETMWGAGLLLASNYAIDNGIGQPSTVTLVPGSGDACVELLLPMNIDTGTVYTVTITNMRDCKGNPAGPLTGQFVLGGNANRFQIVINEIMADESPVVGTLPETEYIELYNKGTSVVSIAGWKVTDHVSVGTVPAYNLFPGSYVILCPTGAVADFAGIAPAVGVPSFPSLNASGDSLEIKDALGNIMDLAYYDVTWYHDPNKEGDGWSMERVDPTFDCMNGDNWRASNDANGGTPGALNSVNATFNDNVPPTVYSAVATTNTTIHVVFSELMDPASLSNTANYSLDQGIGQPASVSVNGSLPFSVDLTFASAMDTNLIYCLSVTGVLDCPGNAIVAPNSTCLGIAARVALGDVIINEILFNPYTGGSDYVELYNNSDKIIDLAEINIGEIYEETDSIFNGKAASVGPKLLFPRSYACFTADKAHQLITYLPIDPVAIYELSSFPSYDDTEGKCVIYSDSGLVLDRLDYLDDWSFPNLDDKNGVSLERLDFNRATQDQDNWHSAASTALYGTPGYKNSQILVPEGDAEVWLQPSTFSPDQDGFEDILAINYHFLTPDWNVRVTVFDNKGRPVRLLKENTLVGTERGTFNWDGTTDGFHKADVGVYVILLEGVNPVSGDKKNFRLGCVLAAKL